MFVGISRVEYTRMGATRLGRSSRNRMYGPRPPMLRAASTNSRSRSDRVHSPPSRTVHLVQPFGLCVPRLEVVIAQRPFRRHAIGVPEAAEVPGAQPVERGPVELRGPADEVVHLWLEWLAVGVAPRVRGNVLPVHEDRAGTPVLRLARQEVAAFEQQNPLA